MVRRARPPLYRLVSRFCRRRRCGRRARLCVRRRTPYFLLFSCTYGSPCGSRKFRPESPPCGLGRRRRQGYAPSSQDKSATMNSAPPVSPRPAEKYSWRPAAGVRSVGEVFRHIIAANYGVARALGTAPPVGFDPQAISTLSGDKPKVLQAVKDSFRHFRECHRRPQ